MVDETIKDAYERALDGCPDADKIRTVFEQFPLDIKSRDSVFDESSTPSSGLPGTVPSPKRPVSWFAHTLASGNNAERLIAVQHMLGRSLREIADDITGDPVVGMSYGTVRNILDDLKERYG